MANREAQGVEPVALEPTEHATTRLWSRTDSDDARAILRHHDGDAWQSLTWRALGERVEAVAAGLVASGVEPGDRVALMSATRLEWTITDLAILSAGAVTVPIYDTSSPDQCAWVLSDSEARLAIAAGTKEVEVLEKARSDGDRVAEVLTIDGGGLDDLTERAGETEAAELVRRRERLGRDDVASIVYTSGTTGRPKGCVLTHGNVVWTVRQAEARLGDILSPEDSTVLFLPLAHIFSRVIQWACLEADVTVSYARSLDDLPDDLRECRPTFLLAVPRVFEKVFRSARSEATGVKSRVFDFAVRSGRAWSQAERPGPVLRAKRAVADKLVYAKLRDGVGGHVRYAVSGGAKMDIDLAHFFRAAGITILEGYGLTETTAPVTVNTPDEARIGTVGRPLPGVSVRIGDEDEVLVKGGNVFRGYHHNEDETEKAFLDDGWFATGDVGSLDDDGYLTITDRKKELVVTASGKNVAPTPLEDRIRSHRLVSNAMVVGNGEPFVAALVTLDPDGLESFKSKHSLSGDAEDLRDDERIQKAVQEAVDDANRAVSRSESVREFVVLERDFDEDHDELTPTMKLRRKQIAEHFADDLARLYDH